MTTLELKTKVSKLKKLEASYKKIFNEIQNDSTVNEFRYLTSYLVDVSHSVSGLIWNIEYLINTTEYHNCINKRDYKNVPSR